MARRPIPSRFLAIKESLKVKNSQINTVDDEEVVRLRGKFLPVLRLHELHGIKPDNTELEKGILVVVDYQGNTFSIFVDALLGQQQTVIKGLPHYSNNVRGVSGCTILGNGDVSLILDPGTLAELAASKRNRATLLC